MVLGALTVVICVVTKADEADGELGTGYDWTIVLGGTKYVSLVHLVLSDAELETPLLIQQSKQRPRLGHRTRNPLRLPREDLRHSPSTRKQSPRPHYPRGRRQGPRPGTGRREEEQG